MREPTNRFRFSAQQSQQNHSFFMHQTHLRLCHLQVNSWGGRVVFSTCITGLPRPHHGRITWGPAAMVCQRGPVTGCLGGMCGCTTSDAFGGNHPPTPPPWPRKISHSMASFTFWPAALGGGHRHTCQVPRPITLMIKQVDNVND